MMLRKRVAEKSGVGEAVVVSEAEDYVVKNADAEDFRGFDQAVGALAVFGAEDSAIAFLSFLGWFLVFCSFLFFISILLNLWGAA